MQLGFGIPVAGPWATPANQAEVARRAEELGYSSLWAFQRLLYPAEPQSSRWQPVYQSVHDPLITLTHVAGHTSRIRLGTAVLNFPWFSPLLLAKQAASLDLVSGGRLDLGLGLGWAEEEYVATGTPMQRRGARAEEFVACLQAMWGADPVEFHGEFYQVPAALVRPKPAQSGGPPVLLGGNVDAALRRAGRLAAGFISSSGQDLRAIGTAIETVREGARSVGRDPRGLRIVCRGVVRVRPPGRENRRPLTGSLEEIRADLGVLAEAGVTEVFADLNFDVEVSGPDTDPGESMRQAHEVLEALAPGTAG
jgi:probable F420-dependent oxidoreductase